MMFFIVGNRYGGKMWEVFVTAPFATREAAELVASKIPTAWNATIVKTTEGESK